MFNFLRICQTTKFTLPSCQQSRRIWALNPCQCWIDHGSQFYQTPLSTSVSWRSHLRSFSASRRDLSTLCLHSEAWIVTGVWVAVLISSCVITWRWISSAIFIEPSYYCLVFVSSLHSSLCMHFLHFQYWTPINM